jgi:hypothetical protein
MALGIPQFTSMLKEALLADPVVDVVGKDHSKRC